MSKRKLPPHIVLPDGRWRFVKRGKGKTTVSRRVKTTRRKGRKVYMARKRSYSRRGRGGGLGSIMSLLIPVAAGAADSYVNPLLPINGIPSTVIGMFGHNETVKNIGLWQVGASIPSMIGFGQGSKGVWL
jgi:hypothetical protein